MHEHLASIRLSILYVNCANLIDLFYYSLNFWRNKLWPKEL